MMEITEGSITSQEETYNREDVLMTYSEEEKQENEINKNNANLLLNPKFVQYDPVFARKYNLNPLEALIYGYIDYVLCLPQNRFFVTNENIGHIFGFKDQHISNSMQRLKQLGLIDIHYRIKMSGGRTRYVTKPNAENNNHCIPSTTIVVDKKKNINIYIQDKKELETLIDNEGIRNELYIIGKMIDLGYKLNTDKQGILDVVARVKTMMARYIPRKEDGRLDRNKAKAETEDWYIYFSNPPKGKSKPQNFQLSLTNWMKPKTRKK